MSPILIYLGVEDDLSEAVARRILALANTAYQVGTVYGRHGFGDLKRNVKGWNSLAKVVPFFLLTDLDNSPCPSALMEKWHAEAYHPNLIFRVAVREVEAWLMADRAGFAKFIGVSVDLVPPKPEDSRDPKAQLIKIASRSRIRAIRERIVPKAKSTAQIGPEYNSCLSEFVTKDWDVAAGAKGAPSLSRAIRRLKSFQPNARFNS